MSSAKNIIQAPKWFFAKNQLQADVVKNMQDEQKEIDRMQRRRFDQAREDALALTAKTMQSWDSLADSMITNSLRPGSAEAIERIRKNKKKGIFSRFFNFFR